MPVIVRMLDDGIVVCRDLPVVGHHSGKVVETHQALWI
jgi:hypothetical protein